MPDLPSVTPAVPADLHAQFAAFVDLAGSLAASFTQARRLLRLSVAGLGAQALLAWRASGEEAVSGDYRLVIEALSDDVHLELKTLLGRIAELRIGLPDGGERIVSGLVAEAAQSGADGGFARYRLTVVPGFALLAHRRDSRVFQDQSVPQIVEAVLAEARTRGGPFAAGFHWRLELTRDYPPRSYCLQYRESDHAFVQRLLAEEGIATRYEFTDGQGGQAGTPAHTLILFDDPWSAPACVQPRVRFHRADVTEDDDTLTDWQATRRVRAGRSGLATFDYKTVSVQAAEQASAVDQGSAGQAVESLLDDYDAQTLYYATDHDELARYARVREDAADRMAKDYHGESTVRAFAAGTWFELHGHPRHEGYRPDEQRFFIRELSWQAENNLPSELSTGLSTLLGMLDGAVFTSVTTGVPQAADESSRSASSGNQAGRPGTVPPYRNRLVAVRRDTPVAPERPLPHHLGTPAARPTSPGPQTATVVGPADAEVHTDALGRIQIRFHWQRAPQAGSSHSEGDGRAAADKSASSDAAPTDTSCWVRVASSWAGNAWGQVSLPRVGQEVLVGFLEGDIDRPVVIGSLYNGTHATPAFAGAGSLPANRNLAGIKSQELGAGQGYSQLLFDDTTGQLRAQLASTSAASELNLGSLVAPRRDSKGDTRGDGFELRTDGRGALRTAQGLLLSTDARPQAADDQLARREALAQLGAARQQADLLSRTARAQRAEPTEIGDGDRGVDGEAKPQGHLAQLIGDLEHWARGSNTDAAKSDAPASGKGSSKPEASDATSPQDSTARSGGQPIAVMSAPAGIAAATPQSMQRASGQNHDSVAGRDTMQTTARRWLHNVGEHISLFVRGQSGRSALKLHAAQGNVAVQAQSGNLELAAQLSVALSAINGKQQWAGQKEVLLTCGGAYVRLSGGNIEIKAPGKVAVKGAGHEWGGAGSMWPPAVELPVSGPTPHSLRWKVISAVDGRPAAGVDVISMSSDKKTLVLGDTGRDGRCERDLHPVGPEERIALIGSGDWGVDVYSEMDPVILERDDETEHLESDAV